MFINEFALCPAGCGVGCDLRIEIVIIIAQPVEHVGIFVVKDRAQRTCKTQKKLTLCGVCQVALLYQGAEEIFLADGDKLIGPRALGRFWDLRCCMHRAAPVPRSQLYEPDRWISRIRLSDKTSRLRPVSKHIRPG